MGATLPAQVSVAVRTLQPLTLQAQIAGAAPDALSVPAGTDLATTPPLTATSQLTPSQTASTSLHVVQSVTATSTTCDLRVSAQCYSGSQNIGFVTQASGAFLLEFQSTVPVSGAIVVEPTRVDSAGFTVAYVNTMSCDLGNDGVTDVTLTTPSWANAGRNCTLLPGQPVVVKVQLQTLLDGATIGEQLASMQVRFVANADALATYGTGCSATLARHLFDGGSELMIGVASPAADFHLLAIGLSPAVIPVSGSSCPLLSTCDVVLGPFPQNWVRLPHRVLPAGLPLYLQIFGVHAATGTLHGTNGITMTGQ